MSTAEEKNNETLSTEEKKQDPNKPRIVIKDTDPEKIAEKAKLLKFAEPFIVEADIDGEHMVGTFVVKRLTIGELGQYSVFKTKLNGDLVEVPQPVERLHEAVAFLQFALVEQPDWFTPQTMYDVEVVYAVYDRCLAYQSKFRPRVE